MKAAFPSLIFFFPHLVFICQIFIITLKMICCEFVFLMNMSTVLQQLQLDLASFAVL